MKMIAVASMILLSTSAFAKGNGQTGSANLPASQKVNNDLSAMTGIWKVTAANQQNVKTGDRLKIVFDANAKTFEVKNMTDPIPGAFLVSDCSSIDAGPTTNNLVYGEEDSAFSEINKASTSPDTLTCKQYLPYLGLEDAVMKGGGEDSVHVISTYRINGSQIQVKDYYHSYDRNRPDLAGTATLERVGDLPK